MNEGEATVTMAQMPLVLLIGAQKAGTSAIADWLFDHGGFSRPNVFDGEPSFYSKEVHFFDIDHRYCKGPMFYGERFDGCDGVDATPDTLQFAERVHNCYKAAGGNQMRLVKIMVILREPILRELSLYNHLAHDCRFLPLSERTSWQEQVLDDDGDIMSFDDFVAQVSLPGLATKSDSGRSSRHGLYAAHLNQWFELFDRSQILVLSYQELQENPRSLQQRIQKFLGREIPGELKRANSNDHDHKVRLPSKKALALLVDIFESENEKLYGLLEANPGPSMEQRPFLRFSKPIAGE
ncbi:unnamed protein product [Cylindrotheca closterium]|uniref:Sulfotransferase domain-containing protein n=1 Tax=Cylindrotheca closterium TaxID=2856 RepID=A0AAD2FRH9_9STRA|nr:unnamed protein product [Cylindrotheca closterium]